VFNDIVSLVLVSLYGTYIVACSVLLYRRIRGDIGEPGAAGKFAFFWGPWHWKGLVGVIINTFSLLYLVLLAFFSFWPALAQVTPSTMNYSCLLFGSAVIFSTVYYIFRAHKIYRGPIVETGPFA
jgi:choline transport protein